MAGLYGRAVWLGCVAVFVFKNTICSRYDGGAARCHRPWWRCGLAERRRRALQSFTFSPSASMDIDVIYLYTMFEKKNMLRCFCCFSFLIFVFSGCKSTKLEVKNNVKIILDKEIEESLENQDLLIDTDGDGVANKFDLENNTPE